MKMTFFVMISCYQAIVDVTNALVRKRNQFIFMPNSAEMEKTAANMLERFKLPRFALAVDGMVARFQEAPGGFLRANMLNCSGAGSSAMQ